MVTIYDSIADSSYTIDGSSGKRVSTPPTQVVREAFEYKKVDGIWKVVLSVIHNS